MLFATSTDPSTFLLSYPIPRIKTTPPNILRECLKHLHAIVG